LTQVRQALATALSGITVDGKTLTAIPRLAGQLDPPAAVIAPADGDFLTYRTSSSTHDLVLAVTVFLQWGEDQSATESLDAMIATSGASSVFAAVDANQTLGGVVDAAEVISARDYGIREFPNEVRYLSCEFLVEVLL
jgi:hypothetical protein